MLPIDESNSARGRSNHGLSYPGNLLVPVRIKGLGGQWAELMWRAGVRKVQDLAGREIGELRARMREVNEKEHLVAELPGEKRGQRSVAPWQRDPEV